MGDGELVVSNEFTRVHVRKEKTRNGERLVISSANLGFEVRLDALELESLTWQEPATFSRLLENPYGPEADVQEMRSLSELLLDRKPAE
jgi:hypothetical protein